MADTKGYPNYQEDVTSLKRFLEDYVEEGPDDMLTHKYIEQLQRVANRASRVVEIDLDDINDSELEGVGGPDLCERIRSDARRYLEVISMAIDLAMPEPNDESSQVEESPLDVMLNLRMEVDRNRSQALSQDTEGGGNTVAPESRIPAQLKRRYQVVLLPRSLLAKPIELRHVLSSSIGKLISVRGIVTRVTAVKPQLQVATYTCDQCGHESYQDITASAFMPLHVCPSDMCVANRTNGKLRLQTRGSKFAPFQEIRLQEEADQVPVGHIPRAITIHAYGETTRKCSAGDIVTVTGIFLPVPFEGHRAMRAGLIADTYVEALSIAQQKKSHADETPSAEMAASVQRLHDEGNVYERLGRSIAPEIFAHDDVKKALLLLLVGGVTQVTPDGMRIRGDINICLMGDPGVAKSQLLKHVKQIAPRCIYATGKGSSGVGLTAAVTRDTATGEAVLEGGALVLADMGICCIDEFDKMEESDRTAIHEVMEQQTVSIAKAGITTTLNARTSVLAAANPAYSRYNPAKSIAENVNLPAALLSRFDLMWLILDKPDLARDRALAEHVTHVHRFKTHPAAEFEPVDAQTMRAYVCAAKQRMPSVPPELTEHIVDEYVALRQRDVLEPGKSEGFTSARTLLAILRLAQAMARIRLSETVDEADVAEARRLMEMSKESVGSLAESASRLSPQDMVNRIAEVVNNAIQANGGVAVQIAAVMPSLLALGATQSDIERAMHEYSELSVWWVNAEKTSIRLVDPDVDDE